MKRRNFNSNNLLASVLMPAAYTSLGLSNQKNDNPESSIPPSTLSDQQTANQLGTIDGKDEVVIERLFSAIDEYIQKNAVSQ